MATPTDTPTPTPTPTDTPTPTPTATSTPPVTGITYAYDGDGRGLCIPEPLSGERGNMVKSGINGIITYYVGKHYEKQVDGVTEALHKYYTANGLTLAMQENGTLTFLLSDHLGSTSVTTDASGSLVSSMPTLPLARYGLPVM